LEADMMNKKGQTAFEALFLFVIVLTAAVATISFYTQTQDDTTALLVARAEANKQLAEKKTNNIIEEIKMTKSAFDTNVNIKLTPYTDLNKSSIKNAIEGKTSYKNVKINVE
jgi:uncharacterized protein (UPF0333 family)